MLKLRKLQQQKQQQDQQQSQPGSSSSTPPSILRVKRDLQEYTAIPGVSLSTDPVQPMKIALAIDASEGYYAGGHFDFTCQIPEDYPNSAPEFHCKQRIYHPNIDVEGHVCLNILRADWKPTLTLQLVFAGILHLFLQPNPNDPLNKDAAEVLAKYPADFARNVQWSMQGRPINGQQFDRVAGDAFRYS